VLSLCTSNPQTKALMIWRERPRRITLPIPSITNVSLNTVKEDFRIKLP
jgi:hypothetical protein